MKNNQAAQRLREIINKRPASKYSNLGYYTFDEDLGGGYTRTYYFRAASEEDVSLATGVDLEYISECSPSVVKRIKEHWIRPEIIIDGEFVEEDWE